MRLVGPDRLGGEFGEVVGEVSKLVVVVPSNNALPHGGDDARAEASQREAEAVVVGLSRQAVEQGGRRVGGPAIAPTEQQAVAHPLGAGVAAFLKPVGVGQAGDIVAGADGGEEGLFVIHDCASGSVISM